VFLGWQNYYCQDGYAKKDVFFFFFLKTKLAMTVTPTVPCGRDNQMPGKICCSSELSIMHVNTLGAKKGRQEV
jgi:hypothetical protein